MYSMSEYQNNLDKDGSCRQIDMSATERFTKLAKEKSFILEKSSESDDIHKHIDYWIYKEGKEESKKSLDLKGLKRSSRHGGFAEWDWLWIEYKNVQGDKGWLYGEQDIIVFECPRFFISVKREQLKDLCESIAPFNENNIVTKPEDAKRKIYSRSGRLDILTRINIIDIIDNIPYSIWKEKDKAKWEIREYDEKLESDLAKLSSDPLLVRLLAQRKLPPEQFEVFTEAPYESMNDPLLLKSMDKAIDVFCNSILNKGKVAIFGDYDCDGIVSSVMVYELCKSLGTTAKVFLPCRKKHGYGLNSKSFSA